MVNDIIEKLRIEFEKLITEEVQVIYILSRIRKILEIDGKEKKYKKLKFYCDWSLHSQIDNIDPIKELLGIVVSGEPHEASDFFNYKPLDEELKQFLQEYNISSKIYESNKNERLFKEILTRIYSDTPLVIKNVKKTKITIHEVVVKNTRGIGFSIQPEE